MCARSGWIPLGLWKVRVTLPLLLFYSACWYYIIISVVVYIYYYAIYYILSLCCMHNAIYFPDISCIVIVFINILLLLWPDWAVTDIAEKSRDGQQQQQPSSSYSDALKTDTTTSPAATPAVAIAISSKSYAHDLIGRDIFVHSSHLPDGFSELQERDQMELQVLHWPALCVTSLLIMQSSRSIACHAPLSLLSLTLTLLCCAVLCYVILWYIVPLHIMILWDVVWYDMQIAYTKKGLQASAVRTIVS